MEINGSTKVFAVLGHPITHSLSPRMHNAAFGFMGLNAIYVALDIHPKELMQGLNSLRCMGFGGVNITVPLKEVAFNGLEHVTESAKKFENCLML